MPRQEIYDYSLRTAEESERDSTQLQLSSLDIFDFPSKINNTTLAQHKEEEAGEMTESRERQFNKSLNDALIKMDQILSPAELEKQAPGSLAALSKALDLLSSKDPDYAKQIFNSLKVLEKKPELAKSFVTNLNKSLKEKGLSKDYIVEVAKSGNSGPIESSWGASIHLEKLDKNQAFLLHIENDKKNRAEVIENLTEFHKQLPIYLEAVKQEKSLATRGANKDDINKAAHNSKIEAEKYRKLIRPLNLE